MANSKVENLNFNKTNYPDVIDIVNRVAKKWKRSPHDAARLLLLEAGEEKINRLEAEKQEKSKGQGNE